MSISEVEIHYFDGDRTYPCYYDTSEKALIDIAENLKSGKKITFVSLVARVCVDTVNNSCYFVEV